MNKVNFTPKKDIGQYLTNDFNISIYNELTESKEWQGTFEPLEFFNVFFENLQIINSNIDNLEGFKKHLKGLKFNSKKYFFLISKLCDELYSVVVHMPEYKELMNFYDYLNSQYNEGFAILYPEKVKEQQRESLKWLEEEEKRANDYFAMFTSFDDVEKKLEHIDDNQEKIKYLIKIKSKFLKELRDFSLDERFDEKCQIEINSLRELAKIDSDFNKSKLPKQPQPEKEISPKNESETLSDLITHKNSVEIVEKIKIQYKNITGKYLKLLLMAFQDLDLLPKERIASKFHKACKNEFNWNIASYNAMNGYEFNPSIDKEELEQKKSYLESIIKSK